MKAIEVAPKTAKPSDDEDDVEEEMQKGNTKILGLVFVVAVVLVIFLFRHAPRLTPDERVMLKWPQTVEDLRGLANLLLKYRDAHYFAVFAGFCTVYIFLQMFAIPGAIFLSILAGPLFGKFSGLFIVSLIATTGASLCYMMSYYLSRGLVHRCLPLLLQTFRHKIHKHRHNLFFYMLFLRISPILPNWFINVASPILNIPLHTFFFATLCGLVPANYIHVTTGLALNELSSLGSASVSWRSILTLFVLAFAALIPTMFRKKFEQIDEKSGVSSDVMTPATGPILPTTEPKPTVNVPKAVAQD